MVVGLLPSSHLGEQLMKSLRVFFVVMIALLCGANAAWGQEVSANITGTVTDSSGAAVSGASVTAKDTQRGIVFTEQTNTNGYYTLVRVPIGTYDLKVEAKGFSSALHPSITLVLNQIARIDFQLKVGNVSQVVEVTGEAPLLQADSAAVRTIIDSATNQALRMAKRAFLQLTLLFPG